MGRSNIVCERPVFWKQKTLTELSDAEWESLCDGCGHCCMLKFEDEDSGEILYTDIRCELFDDATCRCNDYRHRCSKVPDCMDIRSMEDKYFSWLPTSCAYRLLHEGNPLLNWHPLISGDPASVHQAGISVQSKTVCGAHFTADEIVRHIIDPDA